MNLFINDISVTLYDGTKQQFKECLYNRVIDATHQRFIPFEPTHRIWIRNPTLDHLEALLCALDDRSIVHPNSIDITTQDYQGTKKHIQKMFKIICAAGGIVLKKDKVLLIYRLQKWDLPKGKKEIGETSRQTAQREIEEECNVIALPLKKICTTWHSYQDNKSKILKQTHWYTLKILDDHKMKPCKQEGIEDVRWITAIKAQQILKNSYSSIRFVFNKYCEQVFKRKGVNTLIS